MIGPSGDEAKDFCVLTTGNFFQLTAKASKLCFVVLKSIWSSLHLSELRCNPLELDQFSTVETASWALRGSPFLTTSETAVIDILPRGNFGDYKIIDDQ